MGFTITGTDNTKNVKGSVQGQGDGTDEIDIEENGEHTKVTVERFMSRDFDRFGTVEERESELKNAKWHTGSVVRHGLPISKSLHEYVGVMKKRNEMIEERINEADNRIQDMNRPEDVATAQNAIRDVKEAGANQQDMDRLKSQFEEKLNDTYRDLDGEEREDAIRGALRSVDWTV